MPLSVNQRGATRVRQEQGRGGRREDTRHLKRRFEQPVADIPRRGPPVGRGRGSRRSVAGNEAHDHARRDRLSDEQDGDEEKPAAEEHGGEEAVLTLADAVADDADEPQEGDGRERDQGKAGQQEVALGRGREQVPGVGWNVREREVDRDERCHHQDREDHSSEGRRPRRPQRGLLQRHRSHRAVRGGRHLVA